jgi:hypothetical protein
MQLKKLFFLIFFLFHPIEANHNFNQLIISGVNMQDPYWQFAYQDIHQSHESAFEELIEKWENILDTQWEKLSDKVYEDIGIHANQAYYYLFFDKFIDAYIRLYARWHPEFVDEQTPQDIDPLVLNFIHLKLQYLQCHKPVQINSSDDMHIISASFGVDTHRHYLILNEKVYNKENLEHLFDISAQKRIDYQIIPATVAHESKLIEYANLLHLGITQSLSYIHHQSDFFEKILMVILYDEKTTSDATQKYSCDYFLFLSMLESALQSKNPVEVALYLEPQLDNLHFDFAILWQIFIEDLQNCYDADDLQAYEEFSKQKRTNALYENHKS